MNNSEKTPMMLLFEEFKEISRIAKFAGDTQTSGLIDYLCEREKYAIETETNYIKQKLKI